MGKIEKATRVIEQEILYPSLFAQASKAHNVHSSESHHCFEQWRHLPPREITHTLLDELAIIRKAE
jgi:hypothetical protein